MPSVNCTLCIFVYHQVEGVKLPPARIPAYCLLQDTELIILTRKLSVHLSTTMPRSLPCKLSTYLRQPSCSDWRLQSRPPVYMNSQLPRLWLLPWWCLSSFLLILRAMMSSQVCLLTGIPWSQKQKRQKKKKYQKGKDNNNFLFSTWAAVSVWEPS